LTCRALLAPLRVVNPTGGLFELGFHACRAAKALE
jgi:hypothetical protein